VRVSPFDAETVPAVIARIVTSEPVPPSALRPDIPPALERVVLGCLEKSAVRRIPDVAALARGLADFAPPRARAYIDRVVALARLAVDPVALTVEAPPPDPANATPGIENI
jgi:serine/threonine-protein kinase